MGQQGGPFLLCHVGVYCSGLILPIAELLVLLLSYPLSFVTLCFISFQVLSDFLWTSFFLTEWLFKSCLISFPVFLLLLISSFIPLWSEKMTTVDVIVWYDFSPLEFVKTWDLTSDVSRAELSLANLSMESG